MKIKRTKRIANEIKKEISQMMLVDMKDPRIDSLASITDVELSNDLEVAKIYLSSLGDHDAKQDLVDGMTNATGFIKRELGNRLKLRHVPELRFYVDDSIERGMYISSLSDDVIKNDEENRKNSDDIQESDQI